MVVLNWDHTMINVNNLDRAIDFFSQQGITFKRGGHHENWGTENALAYFGLNYIELLTVVDQAKADSLKRSEAAAIYDANVDFKQQVERINTIAIRTDDIEATHEKLRQKGINVGAIATGKRLDQTGQLITWSIFFIDQTVGNLPLPFFIQWQGDDQTREAQLKAQGLIEPQKAGDLVVTEAIFEVPDVQKAASLFAELLDQPVEMVDEGANIKLQDRTLRFIKGTADHLMTLVFKGANQTLAGRLVRFDQIQFQF
ncbi:VOC family protein [Enterococcus sp. CSURQ0835]|uniref:VOC family protein n=1 Tax=Enterococcus sp. CSURQ0835 TaxID=2681394 RepID=UPI00135C7716|nr:VOC family protein [Enterococcus sp. CSURQ0835]